MNRALARRTRLSLPTILAFLAMVACPLAGEESPLAPIGSAFTYQGFLAQNGGPVNGAWDLRFALYDAAVAGAQIGATLTLDDHLASAGVFTAPLDFGPGAFAGGARWLEVRVRPGASAAGYTILSPRTAITPAPIALSLPNVYTDEATNFVGVGRNFRVSGNEVFGVRRISDANDYGGMFVETSHADGWPFYGYATNGAFRAWTYYKHAPCTPPCGLADSPGWKLYVAGLRLAVPTTGGLRIGPSADYSLVIENSTGSDGIRIYDTGDDAIQIGSDPDYSNYGVYIPSPGVGTYGLWPNTAEANGEWALFTVDNIQAGNTLTSGQSQLARVGGDEPLAPGTVVAVTGADTAMPGAHQMVPRVVAASPAHAAGVIGIVQSRMAPVAHPGKVGDDAATLQSAPGDAKPGEFVSLLVRGIGLVRVEAGSEIEIGQRLTMSEEPGLSRALRSKVIEGMLVSEGSPAIGVAVGRSSDEDLLPLYVTLP